MDTVRKFEYLSKLTDVTADVLKWKNADKDNKIITALQLLETAVRVALREVRSRDVLL